MSKRTMALVSFAILAIPQIASAEGAFSGFYGGAGLGYGFGGQSVGADPAAPSVYDFDVKGSQISLLGGYNYQSGRFVFGIEGDANFGEAKDSQSITLNGIRYDGTANLKNYYTIRGRLGFAASENLLLFGTAGPAWGKLASTTVLISPLLGPLSPFISVNDEVSADGYILGLGGEYNIGERSRLRLEYNEVYFNGVDITTRSPFGPNSNFRTDNAISYVRSAVTFKF